MLELRAVTKRYSGIAAVSDVSFTACAGAVTGYLGPNGSGKSTTLKMITGLMEPSTGEILFQGYPISRDRIRYRRLLGYVPRSRISTRISPAPNISRWSATCAPCPKRLWLKKSTAS
jgi:ABC-type multidrug transport system ATPase subunit